MGRFRICIVIIIALSITAFAAGCSMQAGTASNFDYDAFITLLERKGLEYTEIEIAEGEVKTPGFLSVDARRLLIGDAFIGVYEYASINDMEADAAPTATGTFSTSFPGRSYCVNFVSHPYFFKRGLLIVNYVGENENILKFLRENLGKEFASYAIDEELNQKRMIDYQLAGAG